MHTGTLRVRLLVRESRSLKELRDPRVKMVTVTRTEVSGDLQHAKIYVSVMGTEKEQELTMHGLRHAAGFVQSRLAKRLQTRFTPVLTFVLDQGVKKSIELSRILNEELGSKAPEADADGTETDEALERAGSADGTAEEERKDS